MTKWQHFKTLEYPDEIHVMPVDDDFDEEDGLWKHGHTPEVLCSCNPWPTSSPKHDKVIVVHEDVL